MSDRAEEIARVLIQRDTDPDVEESGDLEHAIAAALRTDAEEAVPRAALTTAEDPVPAVRRAAEVATREERARVIALIETMIRITNILGQDLCDACGNETTVWPTHRPHCEYGQLLAAIRART